MLSLLFPLTVALSSVPFINSAPIDALPTLDDSTVSGAQNLTFRPTNCVSPRAKVFSQWVGSSSPQQPWSPKSPSFNPSDCFPAITSFYSHDIVLKADLPREFSAHAALVPPSPPSPGRGPLGGFQTPRKYVSGTCTLAILNLEQVMVNRASDAVPGLDLKWPWPETDTESFRTMYLSAGRIAGACAEHSSTPGWMQLGDQNAMGVFLWGTGSWMDKAFPAANPYGDALGSNSSSAAMISSTTVQPF